MVSIALDQVDPYISWIDGILVDDIELIQEEVFQVWEVKRFLELDKEQCHSFLMESARIHDFL